MLTNLQEGRKTKCHQYWPDKGEILSIDTFDVELDREITYSFYVIRDITITNTKTKQERQVHQFHFITWPDHGTPDNLEFVLFHRRVMSYKTFLSGQIVIHCSAGIGRTGTFIGYDALLTHWKRTGQIDVPSYITTMRNSRMDMIQTHKQYIALHELLLEGYNLPDTYISRANFPAALEARYPSKDAPTSNTKILGEFKELKKCTPTLTASSFTAALRKENKTKNRDPKILAADKYRPFLQSQSPNRTDYINAVVIESYTSKLGFIITQLPLKETGEDFWAMVFDYNCQNIVVIGPLMKEAWLQDSSDKSKAFSVKNLQDLSTNSEVVVNEYEVVHVRSTNTRTVRVYCVPEWPSDSLLPNSDSSLIQLLEQLERRRQTDNTIPVIVMCRNGSTQSGLFCCISNIRDQMKMDEEVDIFQAARQVISRRPEAIGNVEQYQYCYHILGKYLDATCVYMN
ncbi:receptor-type tyrosine-protein phosphatase mu-like [Argopecten irradians]|uniref:receptor-type tyrosine-protein phosphatase mu-like n=1 Tax=Argopecten irradians TaxID=31199 RepID=UPI00371D2F35